MLFVVMVMIEVGPLCTTVVMLTWWMVWLVGLA